MASIECSASYDLRGIAISAGSLDVDGCASYQDGKLVVLDVDQFDLDKAVSEYSHANFIEQESKKTRMTIISERLYKIDAESVRPLRAKLAGSAIKDDDDKLAAIDLEAAELRKELRDMTT